MYSAIQNLFEHNQKWLKVKLVIIIIIATCSFICRQDKFQSSQKLKKIKRAIMRPRIRFSSNNLVGNDEEKRHNDSSFLSGLISTVQNYLAVWEITTRSYRDLNKKPVMKNIALPATTI